LLRPLPYPEPERLVWLSEQGPSFPSLSFSYPNFEDWQRQQTVFEHLGAYHPGSFNLTQQGEPLRLSGASLSSSLLAALKVRTVRGRGFLELDDQPGAESVVVLSHALWQSRFGGRPDILHQSITLDEQSRTVIGVMPPGFAFPAPADLWLS